MAVVEDGVVGPIGLLDLVQRLGDQERADAVARHERQILLKEVEPPLGRELVEHDEELAPVGAGRQLLGEPPADLVQDQAHQRPGARQVGRRNHQVEADGRRALHQIGDAPGARARHLGHHRVAVEAEEGHGGGEHAGALVVRLVEQLPGRRRHHRMDAGGAQVGRGHHRAQGGLDRAARIAEEIGDAGQGLVGLGVEDVEDGADQEGVAGLFPVVPFLQRSFWVDQDVRDVLDVAHLPLALSHLQQRVVGRGLRIGRIEQQDPAVLSAKAGGELPVLTLDVVDDH